mgnify:FL=1
MVVSIDLIRHTIDNSNKMYSTFIQIDNEVKDYLKNNINPNPLWKLNDNDFNFIPRSEFSNYMSDFKEENFAPLDSDQYVISIWRGEWNEYYASPSQTTSLHFEVKDYFSFPIVIILTFISLLCFYSIFYKFNK